jgi:hypothetical protein
MNKGRHIDDILKIIIKIIPKQEETLLNELDIFAKSLWNKAPEVMRGSDCWIPFIQILNNNIPEIKEDWQIEIFNILNIPN